MSASVEFLVVFLLEISLLFLLINSIDKIGYFAQNTTKFYTTSRSLANLSLYGALSYLYSGAVSFEYSDPKISFMTKSNSIIIDGISLNSIFYMHTGGFFEKSEFTPS